MFRAEVVGLLLEFHTPAVSFNRHLPSNVVKYLSVCVCVCYWHKRRHTISQSR